MRRLVALVGLAWPLIATAQTPPARHVAPDSSRPAGLLRGSAIGFSLDRFVPTGVPFSAGLTTVSMHLTSLTPSTTGLDAAIGMSPDALGSAGVILMSADFSAADNVSFPGTTLLIKAGPSVLFAGGGGGGEAAIGGHVGASVIARLSAGLGIRGDVVEHYYIGPGFAFSAMSVGLGITSLKIGR
ncbi:MAG: hypothetical protein M3068_10190 [Gemmatimonadota bacterium]|nr:hypothetical protein [Gemmatimonadota bacterium]